jgi:drug/metabolite transporter (DMT)-like permease
MKKKQALLPYLSGVGFAVIFGFSFMFSRIALQYASAMQLVGLRFMLAIAVLLLLKAFRLIKINLRLKDFWAILPLAFFQPVLYFIGETYGIKHTSASMSGIFMSLIPVFTAGLAYIFLKEKLNRMQMLFVVVSLAGVVLISVMSLAGGPSGLGIGILFLMLAVISAAVYAVLTRKLTRTYSAIEITFVMMVVGAGVFNILGLIDSGVKGYVYFAPLKEAPFVWSWLFLGILCSIVAFFFMTYTGSKVPASQNTLFANLVTVIAIFAGGIFLKEKITIYQIIGSVLIVVGVWGANYFAESSDEPAKDEVPIVN